MSEVAYQYINKFEMTGGLNTVSSSIFLKPGEFRDVQNIDYFPIGGFSKRNGYLYLNTSPVGSSACTGLYMGRYFLSGGTNLAYLVSGTKIYKMTSVLDGTWTDITSALTITAGNNNIWNFAMLNDIAVLGNGTDSPIQLSSSGVASALTAGMPWTTFKFPVEYRGYMFYFVPTVGGAVKYDRGYFSSINDPTTVGSNNYIDIGVGQGGDVQGAVDYKTYLYVFKRHGIYQINYQPTRVNSAGTIFPFNEFPNPVVPGVGTQSHRSICKFTTPATHSTPGQELVFFIDQFGSPRIFDGITTLSFSSKIGTSRDTTIPSLSDMDNSRLPYCFSINYPSKNRIIFFLSNSDSKQNGVWVLDYSVGFAISRYSYNDDFNVAALFEKSDGTFKPYYGNYAGTVYQSDQGTSDNGVLIDGYAVSGDSYIGSPINRSKWYFIEMRGATGSSSQDLSIDHYLDASDASNASDTPTLADVQTLWGDSQPMTWGVSAWSKAGIVSRSSEINLVGKTIRTKFRNNVLDETFMLEGWALAGEPLGTFRS